MTTDLRLRLGGARLISIGKAAVDRIYDRHTRPIDWANLGQASASRLHLGDAFSLQPFVVVKKSAGKRS